MTTLDNNASNSDWLAVEDVRYVLLLKIPDHPHLLAKLLILGPDCQVVHTTHYSKQFACELEGAQETARAICNGYGLTDYSVVTLVPRTARPMSSDVEDSNA